jgi:ribosomal protein S18 acetylase RimI-like enzyme
MPIRRFRPEDAPAAAALAASCARSEADFVLNPMWETETELAAEFARHRIAPEDHLLVAQEVNDSLLGLAGLLRFPEENIAALICPLVARGERGHGLGGQLLRAALERAPDLGIRMLVAGIGTRNRSGYSLLTALGFRPVRQHFLMRCGARPEASRPAGDVEIGLATADDADQVHALHLASGLLPRRVEQLKESLADGRHLHVVARDGTRVLGFAELQGHWPERPWVSFVAVAPEERDQGLGSALLAWAIDRGFASGAREALLVLSPANRNALAAYRRVGFDIHRVLDVLELPLSARGPH